MDGSRFDSITRAMSASRRSIFLTLSGGVLGGFASSWQGEKVSANCKEIGRNCNQNSDCCNGSRCQGGQNGTCRCKNGHGDCDGDGRCERLDSDRDNCGSCGLACDINEACCDATCIDVQSDRTNCGGCGVTCGENEACAAGRCITCIESAPLCGSRCCAVEACCLGVCVNLQTSRANCGACFQQCDFNDSCIEGVCK
jgi:hypothetical protein